MVSLNKFNKKLTISKFIQYRPSMMSQGKTPGTSLTFYTVYSKKAKFFLQNLHLIHSVLEQIYIKGSYPEKNHHSMKAYTT